MLTTPMQFHDSCKSTDAAVLAARAMRVIKGREGMDVVEPAQTERRQNTVHLARNKPLLGRSSIQINYIPANEVVNNLGV